MWPVPITRLEFLRAALVLGMPAARSLAQEPTANPRWSTAAANKLKAEQECAYRYLGEQLKLGSDPETVFKAVTRGRIPDERLSPEQFQKQYGGVLSRAQLDDYEKVLAEYKAKYLDAKPPTPYEEPGLYSSLLEMSDALDAQIKSGAGAFKKGRTNPSYRIVVGTLPTGRVDADTDRVARTTDYLVRFDYGLFMFVFEMAKIAGLAFELSAPEGVRFLAASPFFLFSNPRPIRQFNGVLDAYIFREPRSIPNFPYENDLITGVLLRSMELFILGHEFSHVLLGHAERGHKALPQDEFEADAQGLNLMIQAMKQDPIRYSFWGATHALTCFDIIDRCLAALRTGSDSESTDLSNHPPARERRERLYSVLQNRFPGDESKIAIQLSRQLEDFMDQLWIFSKDYWIDFHQQGKKPSASWAERSRFCD